MAMFPGIPVKKPRFAGVPVGSGITKLAGVVTPVGSTGEVSTNIEGMPQRPEPSVGDKLMTSTAATVNGLVNGVPIIGPMAQDITDNVGGMIAQVLGGDRQAYIDRQKGLRSKAAEEAPVARVAGELGGSIGALGAAAKVPAVAEALGVTGNLGSRIVNSTLSGGAIAGADAAVRGADPLQAAAIGGGISGAIPIVGAGARALTRAVGSKVAPVINAALRPDEEAARRAGVAFDRDLSANPNAWGSADEIAARDAGLPVINADRGGETVRALTRSVANQSPEARALVEKTASDRFAGQGDRAIETIRRVAGGAVDDLAYQQAIKNTAKAVNKPAYDAAYAAPEARAIWSPRIRSLMQAPEFKRAIDAAEDAARTDAALSGQKAVTNPFVFGADGSVSLRTMPDGSTALPSLQFWDIVQRNLRTAKEALGPKEATQAARYDALRNQLLADLDAAVPKFQQARAGAASFFGAEDALEAGKKFAMTNRMVPEAKQAFGQFSGAEKAAFRTGYASSIIDKIMSAGDRTNVINQTFKSPAAREMLETVFGTAKAREIEAYVRVETLADLLRGAMGNSTTARQLVELGIGGGTGFALTGDWKGALAGAALTSGTRALGQRIDNGVMKAVAKLLTSDNPRAVQMAIQQALKSPAYMTAVENLTLALSGPARGGALAIAGGAAQQN